MNGDRQVRLRDSDKTRGRRALVQDLHSEVIYATQSGDPVPRCTGGPVGLLEAAIDRAVKQPGRPIVDNELTASGGQFHAAAGLGHDDAPGSELILDDSAPG